MSSPESELRRIHIRIWGRVQGVGFRAFVQRLAAELGLAGWVKNIAQNQVETVAEGAQALLEQFLTGVLTGPRGARVDQNQVDWETPQGEKKPFEFRFF